MTDQIINNPFDAVLSNSVENIFDVHIEYIISPAEIRQACNYAKLLVDGVIKRLFIAVFYHTGCWKAMRFSIFYIAE